MPESRIQPKTYIIYIPQFTICQETGKMIGHIQKGKTEILKQVRANQVSTFKEMKLFFRTQYKIIQ